MVVHFDHLKPCSSSVETDPKPSQGNESKVTPSTSRAHGVNLHVDIDDDEDNIDETSRQRDQIETGGEILEQSDELE